MEEMRVYYDDEVMAFGLTDLPKPAKPPDGCHDDCHENCQIYKILIIFLS